MFRCKSTLVANTTNFVFQRHKRIKNAGQMRSITSMTVMDLLSTGNRKRHNTALYIDEHSTTLDAMKRMAENEVASLVVVDKKKSVVGMLHQKRIIRSIALNGLSTWKDAVGTLSLPSKDIVYVRPTDTVDDCRAVMALSERNNLPVLDGRKLLGVVSITDIASLIYNKESSMDGSAHSAKSDYITMIHPRKGLPSDTLLDENSTKPHVASVKLLLECSAASKPHPKKAKTGGEDAYFMGSDALGQSSENKTKRVQYAGVADGVGSWFERDIDPSMFSRELMRSAQAVVAGTELNVPVMHPTEILNASYTSISKQKIEGSSTACIISLDSENAELHAINLGDSGFVIVHDKKSDREVASTRGTLDGSLRRTIRNRDQDLTPAGRRKGAHITYRSPQQLHYFNCPYQLGYDRTKDGENPFELPEHASVLRVPVAEGDLIILATDGLFDNMDECELLNIVVNESEVASMCQKLVNRAYELSLDKSVDSPFARLAKENDIMWSGGMPDDITVIAARVVINN